MTETSEASRKAFIKRATAIAGTGVLAACSPGAASSLLLPSSGSSMPGPLAFADTPRMQALLRANGILAVRQNGAAIVRDDMKSNAAFVKHATRPLIVAAPNPFSCDTECTDGFEGDYDGIPLGPVSTGYVLDVEWGLAPYYGDTVDAYEDWFFALNYPWGSVAYGPTYTVAPSDNCVTETLNAIGSAIVGFGSWLVANAQKYAAGQALKNVLFWLKNAQAGEVTWAECMEAVLATLSATEVLAAIGAWIAVGGAAILTIAAIYQYIRCMNGA